MKEHVFHCRSLHISTAWPNLTLKARAHLEAMHKHYQFAFAKLRDHPEQASVAATVCDIVDEAVEHQAKATPGTRAQVRCTRGCAHCCKQNVTITKPEAVMLLTVAQHDGIAIDWERVERQSAYAGAERWHEQPIADRACVFLGANNDCMIYEHRPMACRKHFAVNDPERCDIVKHPGTETLNWVALEAEAIASAAMMTFDAGSMPVMLRHEELRHRRVAEEHPEQEDHDDDREHCLRDHGERRRQRDLSDEPVEQPEDQSRD